MQRCTRIWLESASCHRHRLLHAMDLLMTAACHAAWRLAKPDANSDQSGDADIYRVARPSGGL